MAHPVASVARMDPVRTLTIETDDGPAEAYLAGEGPGVLFYMDAIGLRPHLAAMVERIASWGYTVLAPNVFHRVGTAAELAPTTDLTVRANREAFFADGMMGRIRALTPDLAGRDAQAWMGTLSEHASDGPVGTTGYCMGARLAVRTAGWFPDRVRAVGGFHGGRLATDEPDSPHLSVAGTTASYVFGHADHDASMTPEQVAVLEEALVAAGVEHRNEIYPGAAHGYTMADTSEWHESSAERHYAELRELLDTTLRR